MPRGTRKKRYVKRKFVKRKTARRSTKMRYFRTPQVTGGVVGFPKQMKFKHKYCETISQSGAAGTVARYQFSCNNLFDPNTSGTGAQPMYYDQVCAIYNHWCVIGSKIKVNISSGSGATYPIIAGLYIEDDTTVPTNYQQIMSNSTTSWKSIGADWGNNYIVSKKWSAKKAFGGSIIGNPVLQGVPTAGPSEQQYFTIFGYAADLASAVAYYATVEIEYIVLFFELKDVSMS